MNKSLQYFEWIVYVTIFKMVEFCIMGGVINNDGLEHESQWSFLKFEIIFVYQIIWVNYQVI